MCIAIVSTAHPSYSLVVLSNRDEFVARPTLPAEFWREDPNVMGGRDLQRDVQGTWLGVTRRGQLAILTNFREPSAEQEAEQASLRSRGEIPKNWLLHASNVESPERWAKSQIDKGVGGVGGFSFLFGTLRSSKSVKNSVKDGHDSGCRIGIISNRTPGGEDMHWILDRRDNTEALSNAPFGEGGWPKVDNGKRLLEEAIQESLSNGDDENAFLSRCFGILSQNDLAPRTAAQSWREYSSKHRTTIFVTASPVDALSAENAGPDVKSAKSGPDNAKSSTLYGTQKQSVILVDQCGRLIFVEHTLYDQNQRILTRNDPEFERRFVFDIESWE